MITTSNDRSIYKLPSTSEVASSALLTYTSYSKNLIYVYLHKVILTLLSSMHITHFLKLSESHWLQAPFSSWKSKSWWEWSFFKTSGFMIFTLVTVKSPSAMYRQGRSSFIVLIWFNQIFLFANRILNSNHFQATPK